MQNPSNELQQAFHEMTQKLDLLLDRLDHCSDPRNKAIALVEVATVVGEFPGILPGDFLLMVQEEFLVKRSALRQAFGVPMSILAKAIHSKLNQLVIQTALAALAYTKDLESERERWQQITDLSDALASVNHLPLDYWQHLSSVVHRQRKEEQDEQVSAAYLELEQVLGEKVTSMTA